MSDRFIPPELVPSGVNDKRSRDFVNAFGEMLSRFSTSALLIQDPWTVPVEYLPAMTISAGMTDFVFPGIREQHLRALLADAPAIHAKTGTLAGVRRALAAIGVEAHWTQWWQKVPQGPHDTHTVFLFASEAIIAGEEYFSSANQTAARRIIDATKRWSQDVAVSYGVRSRAPSYIGALARTAFSATAHPFVFDPPILRATSFVGATAATMLFATAHRKAA